MTFEEEMEKLKAEAIAEVEVEVTEEDKESKDDILDIDNKEQDSDTKDKDESTDGIGDDDISSDSDKDKDEEDDDKTGDDDSGTDDNTDSNDSFSPIDVDFGGQKITLKNQDELSAFLKRGAEALNKPADTMKTEKAIIEQGKLNQDDLKLLVDIKNGDLNALAKLAESSKLDHLDIDDSSASQYKGTFEPTSPTAVEEVANVIMSDREHASKFQEVLGSSGSSDFANALGTNADHLRSFSMHVKSGLAEKAMPEARTNFALYGGDFFEHYKASALKVHQAESQGTEQQVQKKDTRTLTEKEKELRKKASSNSTINKSSGSNAKTYDDVMDLSNEDFQSLKRSIKP